TAALPPPRLLAALIFVAGFLALGYEVLWTRYLGLLIRNTVLTYTITLTVVLIGIVLGSLLAGRLFERSERRVTWFGLLQVLVGLIVLATLMLPPAAWHAVGDDMAITFLLLLPAAVLSGAAFPLAVRLWVDDPAHAGSGVGAVA